MNKENVLNRHKYNSIQAHKEQNSVRHRKINTTWHYPYVESEKVDFTEVESIFVVSRSWGESGEGVKGKG